MRIVVHRPVRTTSPVTRPAPVQLVAPPQLPQGAAGGLPIQAILPVLGAVTSMTMMLVMRGSNPVFLVVGALIFVVALTSGLIMTFTSRARATRARKQSRERYLDYLEDFRAEARTKSAGYRLAALTTDPAPQLLPQLITRPGRVWERRAGDKDFLRVRIGLGTQGWTDITAPRDPNPVQPLDPLLLASADQAAATCGLVEDMPVWVDLAPGGEVALIGPRDRTENLARAMIAQAAAFACPDDVRIAAVFAPGHAGAWTGLDHLPHCLADPTPTGLPRALVAGSLEDLAAALAGDMAARIRQAAAARHWGPGQAAATGVPRLVVFLDEHGGPAGRFPVPEPGVTYADLGIAVVHLIDDRLDEPSDVAVRVVADSGGGVVVEDLRDPARGPVAGRADPVSPALFEAIARDLAPLALTVAKTSLAPGVSDSMSAVNLLGIPEVTSLTPERAWRTRTGRDFLRVPIGTDDHGVPLLLDLKESAQLGMGPHGICVGATGSGKSELLRTLVLSLAVTHSPEDLTMILVDYKGGAAFAPYEKLAHVVGLIDNLADDPQLTRRARESIAGEVVRRQELLKRADSTASITQYRQMRLADPTLPPLPHLLLVIDEFGELLTAEPEFSELLLRIGRIGRSIGVHLLLASQRIEAGMLRGLDTHLSYWIGMRTFSEGESRAILGTPDAFRLPSAPGYAYLKVDTSVYTRFRAAYVSGPVPTPEVTTEPGEDAAVPDVRIVPPAGLPAPSATGFAELELGPPDLGHQLVDEVVARLATPSRPAPVWLPPLPRRIALGSVLDRSSADAGVMRTPIGLLDDPGRQSQEPWFLDLEARGGHIAILGAPQTGRSTFLRTVAVSLGLTHTPRQVSVYGLDLTGGGLDRIESFPHVGGVASRADRARLQRLFEELHAMIGVREALFRTHRLDSVAALRKAHAAGVLPQIVAPDVVILVDGVDPMRGEFEELDQPFTALLQRGSTFGIHVVMALTRWNELRPALQPLVGQRLELRLNDPGESTIQRVAAQVLRTSGPGRVLTSDLRYGQIALPVLDETDDDSAIGDLVAAIGARSAAAWSGPAAARIRLLPENLDPAELPDEFDQPDAIPIGLRQDTFEPACFTPGIDQHLLVFGDTQCGKTTLLAGLIRGFLARLTADELVFAVIDPRGRLAGIVPEPYLGGQANSAQSASALMGAVAQELESRSQDKTGAYPAVVVVVDDYDIIAAGGTRPLSPLLPYLPSARDLGLTVLLARPVAGAGRAVLDPVVQALRDTGGTGLVMNGERSEGPIFPKVYAEALPPGRGRLVQRGAPPRIIQIAHFDKEPSHAP